MSRPFTMLDVILADLDQQYARGDIDLPTWDREVRLARRRTAALVRRHRATDGRNLGDEL